jgi:hypothetical protein
MLAFRVVWLLWIGSVCFRDGGAWVWDAFRVCLLVPRGMPVGIRRFRFDDAKGIERQRTSLMAARSLSPISLLQWLLGFSLFFFFSLQVFSFGLVSLVFFFVRTRPPGVLFARWKANFVLCVYFWTCKNEIEREIDLKKKLRV